MTKIFNPSGIPKWLKLACRFVGITNFPKYATFSGTADLFTTWPLLLQLYHAYLFCYVMLNFSKLPYAGKIGVTTYLDFVMTCAYALTTVSRTVVSCTRGKRVQCLFAALAQTDSVNAKIRKRTCHIFAKSILFWLAFLLAHYLVFMSTNLINFYVFHTIPLLPNIIDMCLAREIVDSIMHEFKAINRVLQYQLLEAGVFALYEYPMTKQGKLKVIRKQELISRSKLLQELSFCHYRLVGLARQVNSVFGMAMLLASAFWLVTLIAILYYTYFMCYYYAAVPVIYFFFRNCVWYIGLGAFFFWEIPRWIALQEEANKSSGIVHGIWNKHCGSSGIDKNSGNLRLMCLRFLRTKLSFSAKGYFPFDFTLVHSVMLSRILTQAVSFEPWTLISMAYDKTKNMHICENLSKLKELTTAAYCGCCHLAKIIDQLIN